MYIDIAKEKFNKLKKEYTKRDIYVLGIESSCDETSIAVVENGKTVLSNVIYTQIDIHKEFGGVVPEVASRHHIAKVTYVLEQSLKEEKLETLITNDITKDDINVIKEELIYIVICRKI